MSQYLSSPQPSPSHTSGGSGMAITALVLAILGLLTALFVIGFPLAIIAVILGIISLASRRGGRGNAIAAILIGGLTLLSLPVMVGAMLPAFGKARQSARQIKSSTQMRTIVQSMQIYASANRDQYPPQENWQQTLMSTQGLTPSLFISPSETRQGVDGSYIYIRPSKFAFDSKKVILYEVLGNHRGRTNIAFEDGTVKIISHDELPLYLPDVQVPARIP